ncbi:MAG: DUF1266 domain-containing protein [Polyangiaceae bacterium]
MNLPRFSHPDRQRQFEREGALLLDSGYTSEDTYSSQITGYTDIPSLVGVAHRMFKAIDGLQTYHAFHSGRGEDIVLLAEEGGYTTFWWNGSRTEKLDRLTPEEERCLVQDSKLRAVEGKLRSSGWDAAWPMLEEALPALKGRPEVLRFAEKLRVQERYADALLLVDHYLAVWSECVNSRWLKARILMQAVHDGDWSIEHLSVASWCMRYVLRRWSDYLPARGLLAQVPLYAGEGSATARRLASLVEIQPNDAVLRYNYGSVLERRDSELALQQYEAGQRIDPEDIDFPLGISRVLVDLGRVEDARAALDRAQTLDANHGALQRLRELVERGAPRPPLPRQPEPSAALTERWIIAAMGVLRQRNGDDLNSFELEGSAEMLERDWSVSDRDSALSTLEGLRRHGHRSTIARLTQRWDAAVERWGCDARPADLGSAHVDYWFVQQHREQIGARGLMAWDVTRGIYLAAHCAAVGYIERAEAIAFCQGAARAACRHYSSWREYYRHYSIGYRYWAEKRLAGFDEVMQELLEGEDSPIRGVPWFVDLELTEGAEEFVSHAPPPRLRPEAIVPEAAIERPYETTISRWSVFGGVQSRIYLPPPSESLSFAELGALSLPATLQAYDDVTRSCRGFLAASFRPGADTEKRQELARKVLKRSRLPAELDAWFAWHDGQDPGAVRGAIHGPDYRALSIDEIIAFAQREDLEALGDPDDWDEVGVKLPLFVSRTSGKNHVFWVELKGVVTDLAPYFFGLFPSLLSAVRYGVAEQLLVERTKLSAGQRVVLYAMAPLVAAEELDFDVLGGTWAPHGPSRRMLKLGVRCELDLERHIAEHYVDQDISGSLQSLFLYGQALRGGIVDRAKAWTKMANLVRSLQARCKSWDELFDGHLQGVRAGSGSD